MRAATLPEPAQPASYPLTPELARELRRVTPWDFPLLAAVVLLLGLGAILVYSATINEMTLATGDGARKLKSHLAHVALGLGALAFFTYFPFRKLRPLIYPVLFGNLLLLLAVLIVGVEAGNARRWLNLAIVNFQPTELAKLVFIGFLAHSIAKKSGNIRNILVATVPHGIIYGMIMILCMLQPDFGTSVLLLLMMFAMLFVGGTRTSLLLGLCAFAAWIATALIMGNEMRQGRLLATFDPWSHRVGRGYQPANSQIAIGSGELTGQGLGFGGQTLTGHLPEGENDFIISVLAEQLGAIGVALVTVLSLLILVRGMRIAFQTEDPFGRLLAFGITLMLSLQAATNMLVAVALVPTKGLTFPFVSYGGSSMLVSCAAVGMLLNISRESRWEEVRAAVPDLADAPSETPSQTASPRQQVPGSRLARFFARFRKRKTPSVDEVLP